MNSSKFHFNDILKESPSLIEDFSENELKQFINSDGLKSVYLKYKNNPDNFDVINSYFSIPSDNYLIIDDKLGNIIVVYKKSERIMGYCVYEELENNGVEVEQIYFQNIIKAFTYNLYLKYFLKKYDCIMSSNIQTYSGKNFWKKLVSTILTNKSEYVVNIVDVETKETMQMNSIDQFEDCYHEFDDSYDDVRIVVKNK